MKKNKFFVKKREKNDFLKTRKIDFLTKKRVFYYGK